MAGSKKMEQTAEKKKMPKSETMREFTKTIGNACLKDLARYGRSCDRIICTNVGMIPIDKDSFRIGIFLTDGIQRFLPSLPEQAVTDAEARYRAVLQDCREKYGADPRNWGPEALEVLTTKNTLVLTFHVHKLGKRKARFLYAIDLDLDDTIIRLKEMADSTDPFADEEDFWEECQPDMESLEDYFANEFDSWLFSREAWRTATDRRIEEYLGGITSELEDHLDGWGLENFVIPRKGFGILLLVENSRQVDVLVHSPIRTGLEKIVGDFFSPGIPAAFIVFAQLLPEGGFELSVAGPFACDPHALPTEREIWEASQKLEPLAKITVPASDYVGETGEFMQPLEIITKNCTERVEQILAALGGLAPKEKMA